MAAGFPLAIGSVRARNSEALYQACRFPHRPDLQEEILKEASPMRAKLVARKSTALSRPDWDRVRVHVMRWCLRLKLAQHFDVFGRLLESTVGHDIVEASPRDDFWGAKPSPDGTLVGRNALGRLLMELRAAYESDQRYRLLLVAPPEIPMFLLLGDPAPYLDARPAFLELLRRNWGDAPAADLFDATLGPAPARLRWPEG